MGRFDYIEKYCTHVFYVHVYKDKDIKANGCLIYICILFNILIKKKKKPFYLYIFASVIYLIRNELLNYYNKK